MNKISAEIIADSRNEFGDRLTTFVLTFPRFILAELNTHRMFSRNSASSRAIPFNKMVEMVQNDPFIPIAWQKDHKGMQGTEYLPSIVSNPMVGTWLEARDYAVQLAKEMNGSNVTKQLCNRLLEPFMWHKVIVTSSEEGLENFFKLRCPQYVIERVQPEKDKMRYRSWIDLCLDQPQMKNCTLLEKLECSSSQAEIHIQSLAEAMWDAYNESTPNELKAGEWHIPFGGSINEMKIHVAMNKLGWTMNDYHPKVIARQISVARCARISYLNFEGKDDYEADIKLFERLSKSGHWSPFEHVARTMTPDEYETYYRGRLSEETEYEEQVSASSCCIEREYVYLHTPLDKEGFGWCRNFKGFIQMREEYDTTSTT